MHEFRTLDDGCGIVRMKITKSKTLHALYFGWPPVLGLLILIAPVTLAPAEVHVRHYHLFYEIAWACLFLAAVLNAVQLRPSAWDGKKSVAWMLNTVYVGGLLLFLIASLLAGVLARTTAFQSISPAPNTPTRSGSSMAISLKSESSENTLARSFRASSSSPRTLA